MVNPLRLALVLAPLALVSACGLSDSDRALLTSTNQNAAAAKAAADRAAAAAEQASAQASQAAAQVRSNAQSAQQLSYERSLRK
jgi:hypothetical protein